MDRRRDGGNYNIPFAFLKKRGDNNNLCSISCHVVSLFQDILLFMRVYYEA